MHSFESNGTNNTPEQDKVCMEGKQNEFIVYKETYQHSIETEKINILHEKLFMYFINLRV